MTACSGSEVNIFFSTSELELTPCQWVRTSAYRVSARLEFFGHLVCDVVPFLLWHNVAGSDPCFSISWSEKTVLAWRTVTPPVSPSRSPSPATRRNAFAHLCYLPFLLALIQGDLSPFSLNAYIGICGPYGVETSMCVHIEVNILLSTSALELPLSSG